MRSYLQYVRSTQNKVTVCVRNRMSLPRQKRLIARAIQLLVFRCECSVGYARDEATRACLPQCGQSCVHGSCVAPDMCECYFGHVGPSCEHSCLCNGHSNCQVE